MLGKATDVWNEGEEMITAWQMANLRISIERGYLCIRHWEYEWTLWSRKLSDLPRKGFTLESIADELENETKLREKEPKAIRE